MEKWKHGKLEQELAIYPFGIAPPINMVISNHPSQYTIPSFSIETLIPLEHT